MIIKVKPFKARGEVTAPPSKSYAHRYIVAAFLSGKKCVIENVGQSDDIFHTISAVKSLGGIIEKRGNAVVVSGRRAVKTATVDCGESGSTLRFLIPVAAALNINAEFIGKGRLLSRPTEDLKETLAQGGVTLSGHSVSGKLACGNYTLNAGVSSQFVSGMMFALSVLKGESVLTLEGRTVSAGYVDMTVKVLREFGVKIEKKDNSYYINGGYNENISQKVTVEGDWSGAAFPLSVGALGGKVTVKGLTYPSLQKDCKILEILKAFGAKTTVTGDAVTVESGDRNAFNVDCENTPDIAQIIAVLAAFSGGVSSLSGVERLRLKESDRISAIINTLSVAGIKAEYDGKVLKIYGGRPKGGNFDGGKDHRTVMSAFVLAANAEGESEIAGAEYYSKSYPTFSEDMIKIGGNIDVII